MNNISLPLVVGRPKLNAGNIMMTSFKLTSLLALLLATIISFGQSSPAPKQTQPTVIRGGTAHLGNGQMIENSVIRFENGKFTFVGTAGEFIPDDNIKIIDAAGKHIYPGLIAANTTLGLAEIDQVRATLDFTETGDLNPNVRSIIAYNTDSKIIPTVRSNGVLLAQITPQGGRISGTSSVVQLDAWNWEDAAYKTDIGIHLNWPLKFTFTGWWAEPGGLKSNDDYSKQVGYLRDFFSEAKAYAASTPGEANQRFEAMKGLFSGEKKLFVHVNEASEIIEAIEFSRQFNLKTVVVGGRDAWRVADRLKANNIPVILQSLYELPARQDDDIDIVFKLPYLLKQAGVDFCLSHNWSWDQRNLAFVAGTAATYGLTKEEALMAITSSPAKILGIENSTGTIEAGKDATLIISTGDVLDMKTSNIEFAFMQGRQIDLDDLHKMLYRKFKAKYQ